MSRVNTNTKIQVDVTMENQIDIGASTGMKTVARTTMISTEMTMNNRTVTQPIDQMGASFRNEVQVRKDREQGAAQAH